MRARKKRRREKEEKRERVDSEEMYRKIDKGGREKKTDATEPFRLHGHSEVGSLRYKLNLNYNVMILPSLQKFLCPWAWGWWQALGSRCSKCLAGWLGKPVLKQRNWNHAEASSSRQDHVLLWQGGDFARSG